MLAGAALFTLKASAQLAPPRIALQARKFAYLPVEIHTVVGRPITLAITSLDYAHAVGIPDFGERADCVPGREVALTFTPEKIGHFTIVCDNFCGAGHDDMCASQVVTSV